MSKNPLTQILSAMNIVYTQGRNYRIWFVVLSVVFFMVYMFLPVWLTVGNTIAFQLSILRIQDYMLFGILSLAIALLTVMQAYLFIQSKKRRGKIGAIGQGGVGVSSALFGGLLATAACSSCIAVILGFLGAGSVFFVLENQMYVVVGALALVLAGLYFTIRQVNNNCLKCEALPDEDKTT